MKHLIYIVLITGLIGCQNETDSYIASTSARICDINISIDQKVTPELLEKEVITGSESLKDYTISCEEPGIMFVGSGYDSSQLLFVDDVSFQLRQDSTIYRIRAIWLPEDHRNTSNDLQKMKYEIEQQLGDPSTIRPVEWSKEGMKLTIGSHRLKHGTLVEYITVSEDLLNP